MADPAHPFPKSGKNGPEQPARSHFPGPDPRRDACGIAHADIPAADPEAQNQPGISHSRQEQQVGKGCVLWPQGAQKAVPHPQPRAQQAAHGKALNLLRRGDHANRRLSQPLLPVLSE